MRLRAIVLAAATTAAVVVSCRSAPPPPPPAPKPLSEPAATALNWVQSKATAFQSGDSIASAEERALLIRLAGNARLFGFSELTEGTHEFGYIVRRAAIALADSAHLRGLAIQAPMAEAMEVDRYVRTGVGDPQRLLRTLGSWRWETREMRALVEALRTWNQGRTTAQQIGFYGFEIPSALHAVSVVTSLPDSITGPPLKAWLARTYACVGLNEGAHFGLEGRVADSSYWSACGPATTAALDSIVALRRRVSPSSRAAADVAFAEQMARLIQHHVRIGLRHLKREEFNAEHVLFLADALGPDAKLMLWGGDVEMGRLTLNRTTIQTAVVLADRLGDRYRTVAFAFGDGVVRARPAGTSRGGGEPGLANLTVLPPRPDTYEDVFHRVPKDAFWLDMRALPADTGGTWLRGPHQMRLITELYTPTAPEAFETPIEFPKFFDAVVFVRHVTAARQ
jgi:erythromycin esterase